MTDNVNQPCHFYDTAILKFDLENARSRSWPRSKLMATFEAKCSIDMFIFHFMANELFMADIQQIPYLTLKFQCQGHCQGQTRWSHLIPRIQSKCFFFVTWQSENFWLRYSKFHIWHWNFKVKVITKVKPYGPVWGLKFSRYGYFCGWPV